MSPATRENDPEAHLRPLRRAPPTTGAPVPRAFLGPTNAEPRWRTCATKRTQYDGAAFPSETQKNTRSAIKRAALLSNFASIRDSLNSRSSRHRPTGPAPNANTCTQEISVRSGEVLAPPRAISHRSATMIWSSRELERERSLGHGCPYSAPMRRRALCQQRDAAYGLFLQSSAAPLQLR